MTDKRAPASLLRRSEAGKSKTREMGRMSPPPRSEAAKPKTREMGRMNPPLRGPEAALRRPW